MRFHSTLHRVREYLRRGRAAKRRPPSRRLECEGLENRLAPVVGAAAWAPVVAPGAGYDGVVGLDLDLTPAADPECTGTLLYTGRHILTAAHCLTDSAGVVTVPTTRVIFQLPGETIRMNVPQANYRIHPSWNGNFYAGNDVALLTLPALAPSGPTGGPTGVGAERYSLYTSTDEIGRQFRIVGYGQTGRGEDGRLIGSHGTKRTGLNQWDAFGNILRNEVQSVALTGNPTGGTFRLWFNGSTTVPLAHNAPWHVVLAALEALPTIGAGNVAVRGGPGADPLPWFVEFRGTLANTNVVQLVPTDVRLTGGVTPNVAVATRHQGASMAPPSVAGVGPIALVYDFDNGQWRNDAMGLLHGYANLGYGASEVSQSGGDSGGPAFINVASVNYISGIVSYSRPLAPGRPPDWDGVANNSFGELGLMTRVSRFGLWIVLTAGANHDLVLDMDYQRRGCDGSPDTITARRNGADLELWVNGSLYHSVAAAGVTSLTIRGACDNETITIEPDLGVSVTVDAGGGNDTINVRGVSAGKTVNCNGGFGDDTFNIGNAGSTLSQIHGSVSVNGGSELGTVDRLNVLDSGWAFGDSYRITSSSVRLVRSPSDWVIVSSYANIDELTLRTGGGVDTITIEGTATATATTVYAGGGNDLIQVRATSSLLTVHGEAGGDTVNLGSAANSLGTLGVPVVVHGGPAEVATTDTLNLHDHGYLNPIDYKVTSTSVSTPRPGLPDWVYVSNYTGLDRLVLRAGAGVNRIHVLSTAAGTPVTLWTGAGNDEVNIGSALPPNVGTINNLAADVVVYGEGHTDATGDVLNVYDQGNAHDTARTYMVGAAGLDHAITRTGPPVAVGRIIYNMMEDVHLYPSSSVNVHSTPAGVTTTIHGGPHDDVLTVDDGNHTLNGIQGRLILHGGGGNDQIRLHDYANIIARTYTLTTETVARTGMANISYYSSERLELRAGTRADTLNITSTLAGMEVALYAGDGNDTIKLFPGGASALSVDGEGGFNPGGVNTLDYQAYATDVTVNLAFSQATDISNGIANIQNVLGGAGNDLLVGDQFSNVLDGGPGHDVLIGGGIDWNTYAYSFLPDALFGGDGDDLVIAGFTWYDMDAGWIRDVWALPATFADRVSWLQPWLDPAWAVYTNYAGNQLTGGAGDDWFFANLASAWGEPVDVIFDLTALEDTFRVELP